MTKVTSIEQLKELDLNPYNTSGYVTDCSDVYTVEDFIEYFDMYYNEQDCYYNIHWEGNELMTHDGKIIPPAYSE